MPIRNSLLWNIIGLLCAAGVAHGQDMPVPPASAPAVKTTPLLAAGAASGFCRRLQSAKTAAFTATYYANSIETLGFLQMNTYAVQAQRPNLFVVRGNPAIMRVVTEGGTEHSEFVGSLLNVSVSDGSTMVQFDTRPHAYEKSPAPAGFSDGPGALQCIKPEAALNADMLAGFAPAPDEVLWRRPALVFTRTHTDNPRGLEVDKLYFAADTGELLRYSSFFQYQFKGPLREQERVEYSDWKLNARLPRSTFTLTLPADATTIPAAGAKTATTTLGNAHPPTP